MTAEIIKELPVIKNASKVKSEQVLSQPKRIEAQQLQKTMLDSLKDNKEFDMISKTKPTPNTHHCTSRQTGVPQRKNIQHVDTADKAQHMAMLTAAGRR